MKLRAKIFALALISIILIFSAAYLFLVLKGRDLIVAKLQQALKRPVTMGYFHVQPPLNIVIRDLEIKGLARVKSLSVSPSIAYLFFGTLALNHLDLQQPEITVERARPKEALSSPIPETVKAVAASLGARLPQDLPRQPPAAVMPALPRRLIVKRLTIKDGRINFLDHAAGSEGISITLKGIDFNLSNLCLFPISAITNFELKGIIPWQEGASEGTIAVEGWMNLYKKDMRATVKVEGIDGVYLYPYYAKWGVDLDSARIEKARLNFAADLNSLNNDLEVHYRIELTDIVFKSRPADEKLEKAERIAHTLIGIFKAMNQDKIVFEHRFRTKMDKFQLRMSEVEDAFNSAIAEGAKSKKIHVADILMLPAKVAEGSIRATTDLSKAMIDGSFAVANTFKEALKASFRREPKYEKEE